MAPLSTTQTGSKAQLRAEKVFAEVAVEKEQQTIPQSKRKWVLQTKQSKPENDTNLRQSWTDPTTSKNYNGKEHIAGISFLPCINKGKFWGPVNWWQEVPTRRLDTDLFEFSFVRLSLLWWCSDEQKLFLRYRNRSPLLPLRTPHLQ